MVKDELSDLDDRGDLQVLRMVGPGVRQSIIPASLRKTVVFFSEAPWKISLRQQLLVRKILTNLSPEVMDFI